MKLDPDLLKSIMLELEENSNRFDPAPRERRPINGYSWDATDAHICTLIDLGRIDGSVVKTMAGESGPTPPTSCVGWGLTAEGQLVALQLRGCTRWKRVREWVLKLGLALTPVAVQQLLAYLQKLAASV